LAKENILKFDDIKLHKNWRYDYLQVLWHRYKFELRGLSLNLPMDIMIPLWKRHHVRQIYKRYNSMYKIIAYNPNTFKVRSLTTYNWITVQRQNQKDEMKTTTILEPTTTSLSDPDVSNESADESDTMMHDDSVLRNGFRTSYKPNKPYRSIYPTIEIEMTKFNTPTAPQQDIYTRIEPDPQQIQ
ncbi:MAG: hypothetical protein MJA29_02780, partial [Candidatus Omnitrophica bacterium]|nr:hypothetical protein [Candidatus Omnitrophota bacterium]